MRHLPALALSLGLGFALSASTVKGPSDAQQAFWKALHLLEGKAFAGRVVVGTAPTDAQFADKRLVMHVRKAADDRIEIPFHVGDDRSRTWVLTKTDGGLRLKHDHRKADGTPDPVTQYGGDTRDDGGDDKQEFHADAHTAELIPAAKTNIWTMELQPGKTFNYALRRDAEKRYFRVEFDLTKPVETPPTPWGW